MNSSIELSYPKNNEHRSRPPPFGRRERGHAISPDEFVRENEMARFPAVDHVGDLSTEDTFWMGYRRLLGLIIFVAMITALAAPA